MTGSLTENVVYLCGWGKGTNTEAVGSVPRTFVAGFFGGGTPAHGRRERATFSCVPYGIM